MLETTCNLCKQNKFCEQFINIYIYNCYFDTCKNTNGHYHKVIQRGCIRSRVESSPCSPFLMIPLIIFYCPFMRSKANKKMSVNDFSVIIKCNLRAQLVYRDPLLQLINAHNTLISAETNLISGSGKRQTVSLKRTLSQDHVFEILPLWNIHIQFIFL